MKTTFAIIACLAALTCFAGCPPGGDNSAGSNAPGAATSGTAKPPALATDSPTPGSAGITISEGIFEIAGVKLGMAYDAWLEFYPAGSGVTLDEAWATEGETGIVSAIPDDTELAPFDSAWFLDSKLVGFYSDFKMTRDEFESRVGTLGEKSGQPVSEPPAWVLDTPFFAGYSEQPGDVVQHFWLNEDGREVMMSFHMSTLDQAMFSLINVDLLDGRIEEAVMAKLDVGNNAGLDGQSDDPGMPDSGLGSGLVNELERVPPGEFGFDGVYLGAEANLVQSRYESRGLTAIGMWVDRDWTGRIDGNPMNGAAYPSEAAWFLDGGLVGFMSTFEGSESAYAETIEVVAADFGGSLSDVPEWAKTSDFFTGYNFQGNEEGVEIWVDEASRGMLFVTFEPLDQSITAMLVNVDNYREALETTNEAVGSQGHSQ